jgi:putative transposase
VTSVWIADHGWCYLMAAIDCCTREPVGWHLELRCRARESITLIDQAAAARGVRPGTLTLGTDNGSAFTARSFKPALSRHAIALRRRGYRDPEIAGLHRVLVSRSSTSAASGCTSSRPSTTPAPRSPPKKSF